MQWGQISKSKINSDEQQGSFNGIQPLKLLQDNQHKAIKFTNFKGSFNVSSFNEYVAICNDMRI